MEDKYLNEENIKRITEIVYGFLPAPARILIKQEHIETVIMNAKEQFVAFLRSGMEEDQENEGV
ncbi:hypothetical protein BKL49_08770 [Rodentibacter myodis]|uniref:Uncharacterized protein n=1 Tax=Rodentibacter myodis TaxID=1907939 RepID=A0A1V3JL51_9PAST|nr:hypothetical protein BKL49_08770 [Rodentibacter myodis]